MQNIHGCTSTGAHDATPAARETGRRVHAWAALALLAAACTAEPARQAERADSIAPQTADTAAPGDTTDTYFEGSQRVWDDARARGVTIRGVGQEPGWLLEINDGEAGSGSLVLVMNYGADTIHAALPDPDTSAAGDTTAYRVTADGDDVHVRITHTPCADTMSGERFPLTVHVVVNGTAYQGCGRTLGEAG